MGRLSRPNLDDGQPVIQEPVTARDTPTKKPVESGVGRCGGYPGAYQTSMRQIAAAHLLYLYRFFNTLKTEVEILRNL
jgi:hypothetical protein